jgi:Transposase DDE domain group 1
MALAGLPAHVRPRPDDPHSPQLLVRTDAAGATHDFAAALLERGCEFSVGFTIDAAVQTAVLSVPEAGWTAAYDIDGQPRDGAWIAEITGCVDLSSWPDRSRLIVRRERPHPGAQLRFTDADGHRFTAFLTDTQGGQLADLEVRHRSHARVEDRIRTGKATGLRNLPCKGYELNKVWLELSLTAADLLTWAQTPCFTGETARCEPAAFRYRVCHVAARLVLQRPALATTHRPRLALVHPARRRLPPATGRTLAGLNPTPFPYHQKIRKGRGHRQLSPAQAATAPTTRSISHRP